ncbi:MAG: hypothetical protein ABJG68_04205 [Crocinitomicaceae bacterium]
MKKIIVFSLFIGALVLSSCDPASKYATEISKIDSCLTILDSLQSDYDGIEFDSLQGMVDHVLRNEDTIKKYYHPDTLSMEIGTRMNDCKGIRKTLKGVGTKKENFAAEISDLKVQFESLKTDISEGVLSEEQINEYLARELFDLNILHVTFDDFNAMQKIQKKYYYASVPYIDRLIVELKSAPQED